MTITDYLINAVFVVIVFRQARERELDRRSVIIPRAILAYVAHMYVRSIPTAGNDLVLIGALGAIGLTLGVASGFATHVRAGESGLAVARVGWIAGALLIAGIGSRMVFAFALSHGAHHAIASFSYAHQIGAAAWPVALDPRGVESVRLRSSGAGAREPRPRQRRARPPLGLRARPGSGSIGSVYPRRLPLTRRTRSQPRSRSSRSALTRS